MGYKVSVPYYNSFWLKKVSDDVNAPNVGGWPGLPWYSGSAPYASYPDYPFGVIGAAGTYNTDYTQIYKRMWFNEESRIRGGYNNTIVDLGVRAFLVNDDERLGEIRENYLIFSGVYNSRTSFNETNVFSVAEPITKLMPPQWGGIQKLYAGDTNLVIFQELRASRVYINKNQAYMSEQGSTDGRSVVGQVQAFVQEYGISKNPESFAVYGNRKYLTDKNKGVVLRLSNDGFTEISSYGMKDFFRDTLTSLSDEWREDYVTNTAGNQKLDITVTIAGDLFTMTVSGITNCCDIPIGAILQVDDPASPGTPITVTNTITNQPVRVIGVDCAGGSPYQLYLDSWDPSMTESGNAGYLNPPPVATASPSGWSGIYLFNYFKSKLYGGYDIHNNTYTLSLQVNPAIDYDSTSTDTNSTTLNDTTNTYKTVAFDETINGWVSFYSYKPTWITSLRNRFTSTWKSNIYFHYDETVSNNRGKFYAATTPAEGSITFLFNDQPNLVKNWQNIGYEGSSGWQVDSFKSGFEGKDYLNTSWVEKQDSISTVNSYVKGRYETNTPTNTGLSAAVPPYSYAGFHRKENKYIANLVSASVVRPGEVIYGTSMSGIKGYFCTVKMEIDDITEVGGMKELFSVSSKYVPSSY